MVDEKLIDFDWLLNQKKEIDNFIVESAFLSVQSFIHFSF